MIRASAAVLLLSASAYAGSGHDHHSMGDLNPALGTHGYPDCFAGPAGVSSDIEANQMNMICKQRVGSTAGALKVGCVGDSITAGAHSSGPTETYPAQLQAMLDSSKYAVTNLGACGSTMQKGADSPYWKRPQCEERLRRAPRAEE
jgi:hypothetical protein